MRTARRSIGSEWSSSSRTVAFASKTTWLARPASRRTSRGPRFPGLCSEEEGATWIAESEQKAAVAGGGWWVTEPEAFVAGGGWWVLCPTDTAHGPCPR